MTVRVELRCRNQVLMEGRRNAPYRKYYWSHVPKLYVYCDFCERHYLALKGGCIQCCRENDRISALMQTWQWQSMQKAAWEDGNAILIMADWCEENGYEDIAKMLRQWMTIIPKRAKDGKLAIEAAR